MKNKIEKIKPATLFVLVSFLPLLFLLGLIFYQQKELNSLKKELGDLKSLKASELTKSSEVISPSPIPTPSPQVIYKYIEKPTENKDKLAKIDARIAEVEGEIKKVNEFLDKNEYNQDAQARRRDLEAELGYLKLERIRYE